MSQHVDLTCVSQTWQCNYILSYTTCTNLVVLLTVDLSVKPGSRTLSTSVLSLLSKLDTVTGNIAYTGKTRSRHVCLEVLNSVMSLNLSADKFVLCSEYVANTVHSQHFPADADLKRVRVC